MWKGKELMQYGQLGMWEWMLTGLLLRTRKRVLKIREKAKMERPRRMRRRKRKKRRRRKWSTQRKNSKRVSATPYTSTRSRFCRNEFARGSANMNLYLYQMFRPRLPEAGELLAILRRLEHAQKAENLYMEHILMLSYRMPGIQAMPSSKAPLR